ncbi:N-acetyltransferase [Lutibacter sp. HS1-25]|uniref:GNAT family N-acetyltransferase n=1 Tax=Lutibacter sp. HS1-25 TaxID=2485000 RepID=UPI001012EF83|nr:GNAT family protein [Lutibacter sp. HS1-25]RXP45915.1 N-acetyltransferase [Lutibacter sp. HS1-25]
MLSFRKANENDTLLYFNWANDVTVRIQSFNSNTIDFQQHEIWFKSKIQDDTCLMLVFQNEENEPVGQIRIQKESKNKAIIGVSIASNYRGKGYSSEMLEKASNYFFDTNKSYIINAFIKIDNLNSKYAFEKAGFQFEKELMFNGFKSFLYTRKGI